MRQNITSHETKTEETSKNKGKKHMTIPCEL